MMEKITNARDLFGRFDESQIEEKERDGGVGD